MMIRGIIIYITPVLKKLAGATWHYDAVIQWESGGKCEAASLSRVRFPPVSIAANRNGLGLD